MQFGLRPLKALRAGVEAVRHGRAKTLDGAYPVEVTPLIGEVNDLLASQAREIERSRSRAADLAHGLKTPLAALAADATRLREHGEHGIAQDIEAVGEAMSRHVDRELARARVRGGYGRAHRAATSSTALMPLVRSLIATLVRTPDGARVTFDADIAPNVRVPIDRTDLAEVLGNLLENAARHAANRVRVSAVPTWRNPSIIVEDDGPGIDPGQLPRILERGVRRDERGGAGLGLAIVQDLLEAYGWQLTLAASKLGGLKVTIAPGEAGNSQQPLSRKETVSQLPSI